MADTVGLTMGELDRLQIVTRIAERRHTRRRAAELLGLSERQVRRLSQAFARAGAVGLASRRRGRPSNRRLTDATREHALALVREHYADFGPTFAHQKLTEEHQLVLSVETLRGWMIAAGLWVPRTQRARRSYPPRPRGPALANSSRSTARSMLGSKTAGPDARCSSIARSVPNHRRRRRSETIGLPRPVDVRGGVSTSRRERRARGRPLGSCELDAAARRIEDGDESGSGRLTNREADVERIQDGAERLRLRRLGAERSEPQTVGAVVGGG